MSTTDHSQPPEQHRLANPQQMFDAIVQHVLDGEPDPSLAKELQDWVEDEGWDQFAETDFTVVADAEQISSGLCDSELVAYWPDVSVDDASRARFVKWRLQDALAKSDESPSVCWFPVSDRAGRQAIIAWRLDFQGQAGPALTLLGYAKSVDELGDLFRFGLVTKERLRALSDDELLAMWEKPQRRWRREVRSNAATLRR